MLNKLLPLSFVLLASFGAVLAKDPAPPDSPGERLTGEGLYEVHYDETSRVDRVVVKRSAGSKLLDQETVDSAKRYWRGLPRSTVVIPIKYTTVPVSVATGRPLHYETPLPPYPHSALTAMTQGSGIVQVLFDAQGKPEAARMAKSTGSPDLDDNTLRFVQARWRSSGGEEGTTTLPIIYRLVPRQRAAGEGIRGSTGSNIRRTDPETLQGIVTL